MIDVRVFGESAKELIRVLATMEWERDDYGMSRAEIELTTEGSAALNRAMMRAESKLLMEDADNFAMGSESRTAEQRGFDAFMEIALKACSTLEAAEESLAEPGLRRSTSLSTNCRLHL